MSVINEIKRIKEQYKSTVLKLPNVCGVGIGYRIVSRRMTGELTIMILVRKKIPKAGLTAEALAPQELGGIRTDVLEVGDLRPLQARTDPWRPAPGGVSIGHYKISAGTLGCTVFDRKTQTRLILSNNHIFANMNDAVVGDPILQPGVADGGTIDGHTIARLERFCPINFGTAPASCEIAESFVAGVNIIARLMGSSHKIDSYQAHPQAINLVDAAVARLVDDADVLDEILEIGTVDGVLAAELGMSVKKSGRTTGFSTGEIQVMDATVSVSYGNGLSATFEDQIITTPMSQGGDSGSLLVAGDSNRAIGLLFAGSTESTIHNEIQNVLDCLEVDITGKTGMAAKKSTITVDDIKAVKETHLSELMSKSNVVGVGVGKRSIGGQQTDELALVVMVSEKLPEVQLDKNDLIPRQLDGIPVDVREIGKLEAH